MRRFLRKPSRENLEILALGVIAIFQIVFMVAIIQSPLDTTDKLLALLIVAIIWKGRK